MSSKEEEFEKWWDSLPTIAKKSVCELSAEFGWNACEALDVKHREPVCMTSKEKEAMEHLINFWNAYLALPDSKGSETTRTICDAVHVIQGVLAIRVARRANPELWT